MSPLTTHVLDTFRGVPATGLAVTLEKGQGKEWKRLAAGHTDNDGRLRQLLPDGSLLSAGVYRLTFETGAYFKAAGVKHFFPSVTVTFETAETAAHLHVPLLLSPYGYSTYRGT